MVTNYCNFNIYISRSKPNYLQCAHEAGVEGHFVVFTLIIHQVLSEQFQHKVQAVHSHKKLQEFFLQKHMFVVQKRDFMRLNQYFFATKQSLVLFKNLVKLNLCHLFCVSIKQAICIFMNYVNLYKHTCNHSPRL